MPSHGLLNDLVTFLRVAIFARFSFATSHSVGCLFLASLFLTGLALSSLFNSAVSYSVQTLPGHEVSFSRLDTFAFFHCGFTH